MARMVSVWSFPFRLGGDGSIATVEDGSDQAVEEAIAVAMLTRPGERITVPTFGAVDPAFAGVEAGALQRHLDDFGPNVTITSVTTSMRRPHTEEVTVAWERQEPDGEDPFDDELVDDNLADFALSGGDL
jgi:hypothetical protein